MDLNQLRELTMGNWPVELVDCDGLWATTDVQTLLFLPAVVGPTGTLLLHLLAFTHPTPWTTEQVAKQLGGMTPRRALDALSRLANFHIVSISSVGIEIPTRIGPLSVDHLRQLPPRMRDAHQRLAQGQRSRS